MPSLPTKGSTVTLNTWASTCSRPGRAGLHRLRRVTLALQEGRRVAFAGMGSSLVDDVQQLGHAGAAARGHEAHRDQVALAQRLLQRRAAPLASTSPSFR
jgi:hypothetical protein